MKKIIYCLPIILLLISSCAGTKTFPRDKTKNTYPSQSQSQQRAALKDYNFSFPDLPPIDGEFRQDPFADSGMNAPKLVNARYHIALLLPLSGKHQNLGQSAFDAAQMAIFERGNNDVAVVPYDTKGTGEGASEAAYNAIEAGANIIVGPIFGSSTVKVAPIARSAGIKIISLSNDQTVAGNGTYIMGLIPDQQVKSVLKHAESTGISGIGAIIPNDKFGHSVKDVVKKFSKDSSITYRGEQVYSATFPRYSKAVADLLEDYEEDEINLSAVSEVLIVPQGGEPLERILIALQQNGYTSEDVALLGTGLWDNIETLSISQLDNAIYASTPYDSIERFKAGFKASFGYEPAKVASISYDAVDLAIKLSRSDFSTSALLNRKGFVGVNGAYRFLQSGINERSYEVLEISRGQIIVVKPAQYYFDDVAGYY